jgi:hypothetical protein
MVKNLQTGLTPQDSKTGAARSAQAAAYLKSPK